MNTRRSAFTLIELLVVMTVLSAIFAAMLTVLYGLQKSGTQYTDNIAELVQQQRFAVQLQADAHSAYAVRVSDDDQAGHARQLTLTVAPDQQIQYRLYADRVERSASSGPALETYTIVPVLEQGWTVDYDRPHATAEHLAHPTQHGTT